MLSYCLVFSFVNFFAKRKTRLVCLPASEKLLKICLLGSTEYTNVVDGQTPYDGIDSAYA